MSSYNNESFRSSILFQTKIKKMTLEMPKQLSLRKQQYKEDEGLKEDLLVSYLSTMLT